MKLFEIASEFKLLQDILSNDLEWNEETGEVIDNSKVIEELFNGLSATLWDKLDNSAYVIKELEATSGALKDEAKRLSERAKSFSNNADRLKNLMAYALEKSGEDKVKTDKFTFSFSKNEAVEIDDMVTPDDFDRRYVKIKRDFDKIKIKDAIKKGETIDGAKIVTKQNLQIK
jgi:uncharacterized coiled-coil DUF342 family protein